MAERLSQEKICREDGYLYFLGMDGYVYSGKKTFFGLKKKKIGTEQIKREVGYLYFIDKEGYVARAEMNKNLSDTSSIRNNIRKIDEVFYIVIDNNSQGISNAKSKIMSAENKNLIPQYLWAIFKLNEHTAFFFSIDKYENIPKLPFNKKEKADAVVDSKCDYFWDYAKVGYLKGIIGKVDKDRDIAVKQKMYSNLLKVNMQFLKEQVGQ